MPRPFHARIRAGGFTLIEVLCATGVFALFMLVAINVFIEATKNVKNDLKRSVAISAGRNIAAIMQSISTNPRHC